MVIGVRSAPVEEFPMLYMEIGEEALGAGPGDESLLARARAWLAEFRQQELKDGLAAPLYLAVVAAIGWAVYGVVGLGAGLPVNGRRFRDGQSAIDKIRKTLLSAKPNDGLWSGDASFAYAEAVLKQLGLLGYSEGSATQRFGDGYENSTLDFVGLKQADTAMARLLDRDSDLIFTHRVILGFAIVAAVGIGEVTSGLTDAAAFSPVGMLMLYPLIPGILSMVAAGAGVEDHYNSVGMFKGSTPYCIAHTAHRAQRNYEHLNAAAQSLLANWPAIDVVPMTMISADLDASVTVPDGIAEPSRLVEVGTSGRGGDLRRGGQFLAHTTTPSGCFVPRGQDGPVERLTTPAKRSVAAVEKAVVEQIEQVEHDVPVTDYPGLGMAGAVEPGQRVPVEASAADPIKKKAK